MNAQLVRALMSIDSEQNGWVSVARTYFGFILRIGERHKQIILVSLHELLVQFFFFFSQWQH